MKNMKILGIIAMVAIIGFTMTACDGGDTTTASLGNELKLTNQQVWTATWDENETTGVPSVSYQHFNGDLTIEWADDYNGSGSVKGGKLSLTLGTPPSEYLELLGNDDDEDESEGPIYTISDPTVKGMLLFGLSTENGSIGRFKTSYSGTQNNLSASDEMVMYYYVDKDVTFSATKYTDNDEYTEDGFTHKETYTHNAYSINLKKGWNALHQKYSYTESFNAATNTWTTTATISASASNPSSVYWVYSEWNDDNYSILPSGEAAPRKPSFKPPRSIFGKK